MGGIFDGLFGDGGGGSLGAPPAFPRLLSLLTPPSRGSARVQRAGRRRNPPTGRPATILGGSVGRPEDAIRRALNMPAPASPISSLIGSPGRNGRFQASTEPAQQVPHRALSASNPRAAFFSATGKAKRKVRIKSILGE